MPHLRAVPAQLIRFPDPSNLSLQDLACRFASSGDGTLLH